jgi:hypothetical protein
MKCLYCDTEIPDNSEFCNYCGRQVSKPILCANCGNSIPMGSKYCNKCGYCIQIPIYFNLKWDVDLITMACSDKQFFYEVFGMLESGNPHYIKVFDKIHESESGHSVMSKLISQREERRKVYNTVKNYLLHRGFKYDGGSTTRFVKE